MNTLKWAQIPSADVVSYNVYRSILGFVANLNPAAVGETLELSIGAGPTQVITLGSDIIGSINAVLTGARAYPSTDLSKFLVRTNDRTVTGSIQIVGGTALADLGIIPKTITQKSDVILLANVLAPVNQADVVSYVDPDGVLEDFYAISTIDSSSTESDLSAFLQATSSSGPLCTIQGQIIDLSGNPVVDADISYQLLDYPTNVNALAYIDSDQVFSLLSQPDGSFSFTLLQNSIVRIQIPSINYDLIVRIPSVSFALLSELQVDTAYRYPTRPIQDDNF